MRPPANLDELTAIRDPRDRALAAAAYIDQREKAIAIARGIRDGAIRGLLIKGYGPTAVARMCEVSVSQVKLVRAHYADDIEYAKAHPAIDPGVNEYGR